MKRPLALVLLIACSEAFCMDYTNGFALQSKEGEHVGFMLGSPSFRSEAGDCVFMLLPEKPELVDSQLGIAIADLKVAGESRWTKRESTIVVHLNGRIALEITNDTLVLDGTGKEIGRVVPIPE